MNKLDENYLDLIRESLYRKQYKRATKQNAVSSKKLKNEVGDNEGSPKNKVKKGFKTKKETFKAKAKLPNKSKKKIEPKQVTFIDNNNVTQEICNPTVSNIKNRVVTPFKSLLKLRPKKNPKPDLNNSNDCAPVIATKVSPSLNENDSGNNKKDNIVKGKKRLLSAADSPEVSRKRKKDKPFAKKGKKLTFDDSLVESELDGVINGGSDADQSSNMNLKQKKLNNKVIEKGLDTKFPVETYWPSETDSNISGTWENFVYSLNDDKDNKTEEPRKKKIQNQIEKIDGKKDSYNLRSATALAKTHETAESETKSKELLASSTTVNKKSDIKNGKLSHKMKKLKVKKDIIKTKSKNSTKKVLQSSDSSDSSSDNEFHPKLTSISSSKDAIELSDSSDNEMIVKGLKFQRFCNLFPPTHNEQFVGQTNALNIPRKYFKVTENDLEPDWQGEESPGPKRKGRRTKSAHKEKPNIFTEKSEEVPILQKHNYIDSPNKKKGTKKNNNILDMDNQETEEKTSGISTESETLIQASTLDYNQEKETKPILKCSKTPKVVSLKNGNKIVALNVDEIIYFHGLCQITVLIGELEILGATINSDSGTKKLYSPRGTSLLYIRNKNLLFGDNSVKLKTLVAEELLHSMDVELTFEQHYAVFLCSELQQPYMDFIERYISQKLFPEGNTQDLRLDLKLHGSWNRLHTDDRWEEVLENIPKDSKTVISGGKGVGKSTFLRFAVNFLLRKFDTIRIVDLDPGQSEFYSPGCISVVIVDKPVFGPNYTHLTEPLSSILSHINMGYDMKKYLTSVRYLVEAVNSMEPLTTIINFPGFTQGIGLDISSESLRLVEPNLVIQIQSKTQSKNYRVDLTPDNVNKVLEENAILIQVEGDVNLSYDFEILESFADNNETWSLEARQGREMSILSYFGKLMSESICDLTNPSVNMYSISLSALTITNSEGKTVSPLAINANLVALCSKLDDNWAIFCCHGYGFVRGMDLQTDTLVLITPESTETLDNVSHLVLGSVTTPPSLIMTASGITGHVPYVNVGDPVDLGQFTRRSYLPPRK